MLKGQAKKDYQRGYMRDRRAKLKLNSRFVRPNVRPIDDVDELAEMDKVRHLEEIDADGHVIYEG